ncbi:unnamed protein product [Staurois parvus]|uniref:Uncharacterized protein n=1 Tax=Staurois parvus TaxID=386267 RepID=A0ABN9BNE5_9NEOB|nr:unnamed protein product [Staurois parvus]
METHSMKLSTYCCANLKATRSLEVFRLQTVGDFCALCASACTDPALSCYVAYHLVAELLLFPVASTLL